MTKEEIYERIYGLAACIPPGKVATYGQLAFLAGFPRGGRIAGQAMARVHEGRNIPCHRVVNSQGRCAPGYTDQPALLLLEGVSFLRDGRVNLKLHLWNPVQNAEMTPNGQNP